MPFDAPDHKYKTEPASGQLHHEALDLLSANPVHKSSTAQISSSAERSSIPLTLDDDGQYKVMGGNSLSSIAIRALVMRGESIGRRAVNAEVDRIVALNVNKLPSLTRDRQFIKEGWKLKIWDKELGPDATCKWQPWVEAPPNKWTIVNKCQRALGLDGSWLVVQPGGEAVLNPGARAFLAPNGSIKMALPGSMITAVGGEIHDYGATIHQQRPGVKIFKHG